MLSNRDRDAARIYHAATKHSYTSVRSAPHFMDWANRPLPYKIYTDTGALALPRDLELAATPTLTAIAHASGANSSAIDLEGLTRTLFATGGLIKRTRVGNEDYHFRAAASAGALYPIELYLAAGEVAGLEPGLYHFSPADLKLRGLRRGDWRELIAAAADRPALREARAILIMSAIFSRSTWKYRARAYRYCFWDAGTMLANLLAAVNAEALPTAIVTLFEDAAMEALLGVDGDREGVVALVAIGRTATPPAPAPALAPLALETVPLAAQEPAYDDLIKLQRASRLASPEEVAALLATTAGHEPLVMPAATALMRPPALAPDADSALGATILQRGSTRTFAREALGADELGAMMAAQRKPLPCDFPRLVEPYLIVNQIDGMEPGAYYYDQEAGGFLLLGAGDFRGEAGYLCLEQPLGADCSALVCLMGDLERALELLGNRGYRAAQLEAGVRAGQLYLAAYALGRGATGLTFYDDDTTKFFSPHAAAKSPLLMVALGVPRPRP